MDHLVQEFEIALMLPGISFLLGIKVTIHEEGCSFRSKWGLDGCFSFGFHGGTFWGFG
jgi:hypothetical protein